jgi:peptidoglycan glycosyltransferase
MNTSIFRLYALFVVLFGVLIAFSSRWAVFGAAGLRENPKNSRVVIEEQRIKRGVIRAANDDVLAGSTALSDKRYERRYPTGSLFAQPVGFDSIRFGRAGLERYYNDSLTGRKEELANIVDSLVERDRVGDDLHTTLEPKAQQVAYDQLGDRKGAVVALRVKDGAVLVLAGNPSFNPDRPNTMGINFATQGLFPPGSTFKTVTAAAALDTGDYEPDSRVSGKNGKVISGTPLNNFGQADYGEVTLTEALTKSINTVWAEVGVELGRDTMQEYMDRFGFYEKPPMDYPAEQMEASGPRRRGEMVPMSSQSVDVGRTAIGQALLLVTPLQMATVAQTIGNGGVRMEPRLVEKVIDPDGRTVDEPLPERAERVMSADAASKLGTMMKSVVREGSGTAAALEGVELAGKTGTAEIDINRGINDLWFIGFTDEVAIAVIVDRQQGLGGTVAAPIAKNVLQALGQ